MKICMVAGSKVQSLAKVLKENKKVPIDPEFLFYKAEDLVTDILKSGISFLATVDTIIVFDAALKGKEDTEVRKNDFLRLQDILASKGFTKKLYYLTADMSVYKVFKNSAEMDNNFLYKNTMILSYKDQLTTRKIIDTLLGKNDTSAGALKHKDFGKNIYLESEEDIKKQLTADNSMFDDSIKNYGRNEPTSEFDHDIYIDSRENQKAIRKNEIVERKKERAEKKGKSSKVKSKREKTRKLEEYNSVSDNAFKRAFNIKVDDITLSTHKSKILKDYGLLGVSGITGTGVSGIVSNIAEVYGLLNKKVAVLDLNLEDRKQTIYFDNFSDGKSDTLTPLVKNPKSRTVLKNSVTDLIDVFSISRLEDEEITDDDIVDSFYELTENLKQQYEIVIADIPMHLIYALSVEDALQFNSFLWVTENMPVAVEDLILLKLRDLYSRNTEAVEELIYRSFIMFNKYVDDRKGYNDTEFDEVELADIISSLPSPYSNIVVVGRLAYMSEWENQFYGDGLWVNYEPDNEGVVIGILGRIKYQ